MMKKINIKFIILSVLILSVSCTSEFDKINTNPNTLTADQLNATMAGPSFANALYKGISNASWSIPGDDYGTYGLITMLHSMMYVHYTSPGWAAATDANGVNDGWRSRGWLRFYTLAVPSLRNAYTASEGNPEALAVLDIWKAYMFHRFTDSWGPVPYSQAGVGGASVAYDSQQSMYQDFFKLLDAANATLSASSETTIGVFKGYDRVYDGDVEKWRRFGNSLRLRLALRLSDVDASTAKAQAEAAVAAGVIDSNAGSAYFATSNDAYNNFVDVARYWGFYMSSDMESILKGYNDPRLPVWFAANSKGHFVGQPNGAGAVRNWSADSISLTNQTTTFGDPVAKPIEVMMASETFFNLAEGALNGWSMGGETAQAYYEKGVTLSLQQWGITSVSDINAYITGTNTAVEPAFASYYDAAGISTTPPVDVPVLWAGTESDQRKQIAVQKYLGLFPESWEAWSDLRRTDADILYPLITTENSVLGKGVMKRLTYLPNEYSTNAAAVGEAVSTIQGGQDVGNANVWWDVN
jgi:hypothetical protein